MTTASNPLKLSLQRLISPEPNLIVNLSILNNSFHSRHISESFLSKYSLSSESFPKTLAECIQEANIDVLYLTERELLRYSQDLAPVGIAAEVLNGVLRHSKSPKRDRTTQKLHASHEKLLAPSPRRMDPHSITADHVAILHLKIAHAPMYLVLYQHQRDALNAELEEVTITQNDSQYHVEYEAPLQPPTQPQSPHHNTANRIQQLEEMLQTLMNQNTKIIATNHQLVLENQKLKKRLEQFERKHSSRRHGVVNGTSSPAPNDALTPNGTNRQTAKSPNHANSPSPLHQKRRIRNAKSPAPQETININISQPDELPALPPHEPRRHSHNPNTLQKSPSPSPVQQMHLESASRKRSPFPQSLSPSVHTLQRPATREHTSSQGRVARDTRSPSPEKSKLYFSPKASPFPIVKPSKSRATSAGATRQGGSASPANQNGIRPRSSGASRRVAGARISTTPTAERPSPQLSRQQQAESLAPVVPPLVHAQFSTIQSHAPQQESLSSRRRSSEVHAVVDTTHHMIPYASPTRNSTNVTPDQSSSHTPVAPPQHALNVMSTDEIQYILLFLAVPEIVQMSVLSWEFFDIVNDNRLWKRLFYMYFSAKRHPFHKKWKKEFYVYSKFLQWHPSDHSEYVEFQHKKQGILATYPTTRYRLEDSQPYVARLKSPIPSQGVFEIEFTRGSVYHNTGVGIATLELMHHAFAWNHRPFNICKDGHELHVRKTDIDFLPRNELGNIWGDNNNMLGSYVTIQDPPTKGRLSKGPLLPHTSYLNMLNVGLFSNFMYCMGIKFDTGVRIKKGDSIIMRIDNQTHATKARNGCWMLSKGGMGSLAFYVNRRQVGIQLINIFQKPREQHPVFVVANIGDGGLLLQNANHVLKV